MIKLKNLFLPKEIKQCLQIIENFQLQEKSNTSNNEDYYWGGIVLKNVKSSAIEEIKKYSKTFVDAISSGKINSQKAVFRAFYKICREELISGHNHQYRGYLSLQGRGYYYIFSEALNRLNQLGDLDEATVRLELDNIDSEIKTMG